MHKKCGQVVAYSITAIVAAKQAWQPNITVVPVGGGPPIAPTLHLFQDINHSVSLQHLQEGVKGNRLVEIQCEGLEQRSESPLDGPIDIIAMFLLI